MLAASYLCSLWLLASGLLATEVTEEVTKKTITLNLKKGERNAYLDEGFASFVLVKNDSILTNPDVFVFPQYGFESDATSVVVNTELLQTEIIGFFPMFDQNRAILLQLYPGSELTETPPAFNCLSFELESGSYKNTKILPIKFDFDITKKEFSSNPSFFKPLTATQLNNSIGHIVSEQQPEDPTKSFSFFSFLPDNNTLIQVLCEIRPTTSANSSESTEEVSCRQVFSKFINQPGSISYQQFNDMQVVDYSHDSVAVILYSSTIAVAEFARQSVVTNLKFFDTDKSYNFLRWFKGGWYGVSRMGGVDNLVKLKQTAPTGKMNNGLLSSHIFIPFIAKDKTITFNKVWATESLLVLQYVNPNNNTEVGVSVVYFSEPALIPGMSYVRDPTSENYDILDQSGRVLKQLMYPVAKGEFIQNCMEWDGTLVLFGRRMMSILPLPLTLNIPQDKTILYQMNGNMNSTYSITGSNIFYVLPSPPDKQTRSMTLLKDILVMVDLKGDRVKRKAKLHIQEVSIANPIVQLDTFDETKLLAEGPLEFDVCFTYNITKCTMVQYHINYICTDKKVDYLILGALGGIGVVLLVVIVVFIMKARKAIKGKKNLSSTIQKHQTLLAEDEDDSRHEAMNFSGYQKKTGQGY